MDSQSLIINPNLSYSVYKVNDEIQNIQFAAPKTKSSIIFSSFHKNKNVEEFNIACAIMNNELKPNISKDIQRKLCEYNLILNDHEISKYPKIVSPLKQKNIKVKYTLCPSDYTINPNMFISSKCQFPNELKKLYKNKLLETIFKKDDHILWIKGLFNNIWFPYKLDLIQDKHVIELVNNKDYVNIIKPDNILFYRELDIVIPKDHLNSKNIYNLVRKRTYEKDNSILIKSFLNSTINKCLSSYYNQMQKQGFLRFGDYQSPKRYWSHNEAISRFIHFQIHPVIENIVGKKLIPTFSTFMSYQDKSSLKKHIDRPQAYLTVGILLNHLKDDSDVKNNWPIYVEKRKNSDVYYKYLAQRGDMIIFEGSKLMHYRLQIPKNYESRIMLFHFADGNFDGELL